jgi:hypothetical protein
MLLRALTLKDRESFLKKFTLLFNKAKLAPIIDFDLSNLDELKGGLSAIMSGFREWIETKRRQEFFETLGKIAIQGLAVIGVIAIISGIIRALSSSSKK